MNDLVRTAGLKKTFSKSDSSNWSYKLYEITEISDDTIPGHRTENIPERYNKALVKKTELTMIENDSVKKKLTLN